MGGENKEKFTQEERAREVGEREIYSSIKKKILTCTNTQLLLGFFFFVFF